MIKIKSDFKIDEQKLFDEVKEGIKKDLKNNEYKIIWERLPLESIKHSKDNNCNGNLEKHEKNFPYIKCLKCLEELKITDLNIKFDYKNF